MIKKLEFMTLEEVIYNLHITFLLSASIDNPLTKYLGEKDKDRIRNCSCAISTTIKESFPDFKGLEGIRQTIGITGSPFYKMLDIAYSDLIFLEDYPHEQDKEEGTTPYDSPILWELVEEWAETESNLLIAKIHEHPEEEKVWEKVSLSVREWIDLNIEEDVDTPCFNDTIGYFWTYDDEE